MSLKDKNRILRLKKGAELRPGLSFPAGFQFEIIQGVVYCNGQMLQTELQSTFKKWIDDNPNLFDITTNF